MTLDEDIRRYERESIRELKAIAAKHQIKPISKKRYQELVALSERILCRQAENTDLKSIGRNYPIHLRDDYAENPLEEVRSLEKEIKRVPKDAELHYRLAIAYNEVGLYRGARIINRATALWRILKQLETKFSVRLPFLFSWSEEDKVYNNLNDILSAITSIDNTDHRILFLLSYAICQAGEDLEEGYRQRAVNELERASKLGYHKAFTLMVTKFLGEAYCRTFISLNKKEREGLDVESHYEAGDEHLVERNYVKAIEEYKKGIFYLPPESKGAMVLSQLLTPIIFPFFLAKEGIAYVVKKLKEI